MNKSFKNKRTIRFTVTTILAIFLIMSASINTCSNSMSFLDGASITTTTSYPKESYDNIDKIIAKINDERNEQNSINHEKSEKITLAKEKIVSFKKNDSALRSKSNFTNEKFDKNQKKQHEKLLNSNTKLKMELSRPFPKQNTKKNGQTIEMFGTATAYCAKEGSRTSTGKIPIPLHTAAVNPKIIPYGTKFMVQTLNDEFIGPLIAEDTGGALRQNAVTVDIFMDSKEKCFKFGRQKIRIHF